MELIQDRSSELEIAWMLATLGNKAAKGKTKREINKISIPKLCQELNQTYLHNNIRYSSNILYGISIIHRHKVNYFYNDVTMIRDQLKHTQTFRIMMNTSGCLETLIPSKRTHHLQDINFRIEVDLTYPLEDDEEWRPDKRRRLEIRNVDTWGFGEIQSKSQIEQIEQTEQDVIDQFIEGLDEDNSMEMNVDFNLDGEDQPENGQEQEQEQEQGQEQQQQQPQQQQQQPGIESLIDDLVLQTVEEANQENHASISNDPNFHLSTTNNLQTEENMAVPYQKLKIDEETILTRTQMLKSVQEYESKMLAKQYQKVSESERFDEIIKTMQFDFSVYSDYVHRSIFQNHYKSGRKLRKNSFLDSSLNIGTTGINLQEESEHARRASRENLEQEPEFNLNLNLNNLELEVELPRSQEEIFNISFGNALRSSSSRAPTDRTDISTYSDISTSEQTVFGRQLQKFFKYTNERSQALGTKFISSEYGLNTLSDPTKVSSLKTNIEYYRISFSDLVPNNTNAKELDELPMKRKHAAKSFSNILNLATKNLLVIDVIPLQSFEILQASSIEIIVQAYGE